LKNPAELFLAKSVPVADVPSGAVTNLDAVRGARLRRALAEGHMLRGDDFTLADWISLPTNGQIFALPFSDCILPPNGIAPGMRVDVILCVIGGKESAIPNLLVDSIGPAKNGEDANASEKALHLLLRVEPEDAARFSIARSVIKQKFIVRIRQPIAGEM
jgi:hypothetical protein